MRLSPATARDDLHLPWRDIDMFGRLTWAAIPFDQPIVMVTSAVVGATLLAVLLLVTVKGWWPYLWREWITSVDHKRIGVMYMILGLVMLVRGFSDAHHDAQPARAGCGRAPRAICRRSTTTRSSRPTARS